jgi:hypothetical protein
MSPFALVSVLLTASAQDRLAYYADADHDGYGDPATTRYATVRPPGYTRNLGDCDDTDAGVHPGATERCNDRDDDCDGLDDDDDTDVVGGANWFADMDEDGFGDHRDRMRSCVQPSGFVDNPRDCDDADDMRNPRAFEFCSDGDDDDCDGQVDECDISLDDAALVIESSARGTVARGNLAVADMDGNGTGDLVVGSPPYDDGGVVYFVYGPASGRVLVDDAVTIRTRSTDESFGWGVGGGDADGDGFDDLLVGAPLRSPSTTYLFLGPVTSDRDVRDADAMLTNRSAYAWEGLELLVVTDHDGDGAADVVVGSADDGDVNEGAVYVAPGASTGTLDLSRSDATYVYEGDGVDVLGEALADLGDVNGDGIDDLAMCATYDGEIFLVEGGLAPGRYHAADVAATTIEGFRWGSSYMGGLQAVDYDGDGAMDLVAGDPGARISTGASTGGAYALVAPWADAIDVQDDAMATWEWTSETPSTSGLGRALAAGDFDGDEETDLVIQAYTCCGHDWPGVVFFQWGVASGLVDVGTLPYVTGVDRTDLGVEMAALPDWNGDGISEVAIEAYFGVNSSGTYDGVIYGFFSGSY